VRNGVIHRGQRAKIITERVVFEVAAEGLVLTEVAKGVDVRKDIIEQMEFARRALSTGPRPWMPRCSRTRITRIKWGRAVSDRRHKACQFFDCFWRKAVVRRADDHAGSESPVDIAVVPEGEGAGLSA
jgi:hypothetical protein